MHSNGKRVCMRPAGWVAGWRGLEEKLWPRCRAWSSSQRLKARAGWAEDCSPEAFLGPRAGAGVYLWRGDWGRGQPELGDSGRSSQRAERAPRSFGREAKNPTADAQQAFPSPKQPPTTKSVRIWGPSTACVFSIAPPALDVLFQPAPVGTGVPAGFRETPEQNLIERQIRLILPCHNIEVCALPQWPAGSAMS
jgi:hypothetical protein